MFPFISFNYFQLLKITETTLYNFMVILMLLGNNNSQKKLWTNIGHFGNQFRHEWLTSYLTPTVCVLMITHLSFVYIVCISGFNHLCIFCQWVHYHVQGLFICTWDCWNITTWFNRNWWLMSRAYLFNICIKNFLKCHDQLSSEMHVTFFWKVVEAP